MLKNIWKKHYWIYVVIIIILIFLAIQWFTLGAGPVETNWKDVKTTMLANNDIQKIIVVNEKEAQIYLKQESYEKYKARLNNGFTAPTKYGPHYFFTIGSVDSFEKNLQEVQSSVAEENKVSVEYKTVNNYLGELLNWILPILIIPILLYVYFIPSIIGRKKKNSKAIFLLNLFLGWTFIGWVGALVWAVMKDD
jgi:hypothetical protein